LSRPVYPSIEVDDEVINLAKGLVTRRALRAYDAIQLASAMILNKDRKKAKLDPLVFISADNSLNTAGELEGLNVDNPNSYTGIPALMRRLLKGFLSFPKGNNKSGFLSPRPAVK